MASRLSSREDDLTSPLSEDIDEDEEEVVVKSKIKPVDLLETGDDGSQSAPLDSHIDTPPNGDLASTMTLRSLTLEVADTESGLGHGGGAGVGSEYRLWESNGEFGLSGPFKIQGKKRTLMLEDDLLQWYQKGKEREKEVLSLADIMMIVPLTSKGKGPHEATKFKVYGLQSQPGTSGKLLELVCQPDDPHPAATTQTWVEHLSQQIQNFGNRPRRLYVIINPLCGNNSGEAVWAKVEPLFRLANINADVFVTQRRFHARELMQSLDLAQYDGVIVVGGDGSINEVVNGLMVQAQQTAGVNLRRSRFLPVQPNIRVGIIPAGFSNSIAWSILGTRCPVTAAAQILLGCVSPMDVSSISSNGQLLLFSAGPISYGLMSEVSVFSRDFTWLGDRRIDIAQLRAVLYNRDFEAEISYVPEEDHASILSTKAKCYSRCNKCTNYDSPLEPAPSVINEKGASVMATYSNVDRVPDEDWKKITGVFSTVISCPITCRSQQASNGLAPWAHQGNGCTDLLLIRQSSKLDLIKWLLKQRKSEASFDMPFVQIQRVKEFKFREILVPPKQRAEEEENLVTNEAEDEDDMTNRRGGIRHQQSRDMTVTPTSHWNVDGDDLNRTDIDVRIHRHMLQVFSRGVEPASSTEGNDPHTEETVISEGIIDRIHEESPSRLLEPSASSDRSGQYLISSS